MIYKFLEWLEGIFGIMQGKGYLAPMQKEIDVLFSMSRARSNIAIDIGANIGDYTELLIKKNPNLRVHLFEPSRVNSLKLQERFKEYSNLVINKLALSNVSEKSILFSNNEGSGLASLTKRRLDHFNIDFALEENVETIQFQDYWINNIDRSFVDIVKIDVEGNELKVLEGFGEAIFQVGVIQFEFGGTCIDTRTFFQDIWYFFIEKGFDIYRITPFGTQKITCYKESDEKFIYTNFIAVNKNI